MRGLPLSGCHLADSLQHTVDAYAPTTFHSASFVHHRGDWGTVEHSDFLTLLKELTIFICSFLDFFCIPSFFRYITDIILLK